MPDTLHVGAGELAGVVRFYRVWRLTHQLYFFTTYSLIPQFWLTDLGIFLSLDAHIRSS